MSTSLLARRRCAVRARASRRCWPPAHRHSSPTATATEIAMQRSPADPNAAPTIASAASFDIGIGHHDQMVLRAAQCLHAFAVLRAELVAWTARHGRRAHERHRLARGVRQQRLDRVAVALHARFIHAIRQRRPRAAAPPASRPGVGSVLGGFQHEGIAAGKRQRKHPQRHHHGEIERRDADHHAERLAQVPVVDAAADVVGMHAGEQARRTAGELHHLDAARDLAARIGQHLAVLARDEARQCFAVLFEQLVEPTARGRASAATSATTREGPPLLRPPPYRRRRPMRTRRAP